MSFTIPSVIPDEEEMEEIEKVGEEEDLLLGHMMEEDLHAIGGGQAGLMSEGDLVDYDEYPWNDPVTINMGGDITITSNHFRGMTIDWLCDAATPYYFLKGGNYINFSPAPATSPYRFIVTGRSEGGCNNFNLMFNVVPDSVYAVELGGDTEVLLEIWSGHVRVQLSGVEMEELENGQVKLPQWTVGLYSYPSGTCIEQHQVNDIEYTFDTSSLSPGIYIVRAVYQGQAYSKKFQIMGDTGGIPDSHTSPYILRMRR